MKKSGKYVNFLRPGLSLDDKRIMNAKIVDFASKRSERVEKRRRAFERVVFQNFLGTRIVINQDGTIHPVELVDISRKGLLFQIAWNPKCDKKMNQGTEIKMRMYFTEDSYIALVAHIRHGYESIVEGDSCMNYGCEFDTTLSSFEALNKFVQFLHSFAQHSRCDRTRMKLVS